MTTLKRITLANAERAFKSHWPTASIEGHTGHDRKRYYLVRKQRSDTMPIGEGNTKPAAWRDACERLGITGEKP